MPSPLVTAFRGLLDARDEERRPLTVVERAMILATLARYDRQGEDALDTLEHAIAHARRVLLADTAGLGVDQRRAVQRLLAAARDVLTYTPPAEPYKPAEAQPDPTPDTLRPRWRADVDG